MTPPAEDGKKLVSSHPQTITLDQLNARLREYFGTFETEERKPWTNRRIEEEIAEFYGDGEWLETRQLGIDTPLRTS